MNFNMKEITFYGIDITLESYMVYPEFTVKYGNSESTYNFKKEEFTIGIPLDQARIIRYWARIHKKELNKYYKYAKCGSKFEDQTKLKEIKIAPLHKDDKIGIMFVWPIKPLVFSIMFSNLEKRLVDFKKIKDYNPVKYSNFCDVKYVESGYLDLYCFKWDDGLTITAEELYKNSSPLTLELTEQKLDEQRIKEIEQKKKAAELKEQKRIAKMKAEEISWWKIFGYPFTLPLRIMYFIFKRII